MTKSFFAAAFIFLSLQTALSKDFDIISHPYPPFAYKEKEVVTGAMTEAVKKVCEKLGHKCTFSIETLSRALKQIETGESHVLSSLTPNASRESFASFSPVISQSNISYIASAKTSAEAKSLKDLSGWVVGVVKDSISGKQAKEHSKEFGFKIVEEIDNATLVKKLMGGRYGEKGAVVGSEDVFNFLARQSNGSIRPLFVLETIDYAFAYSKKKMSEADQKAFNQALAEIRKDGTLKAILDKYAVKIKN